MTRRIDLMAALRDAMLEVDMTTTTFCHECTEFVELKIRERHGMTGYGNCPQCGLALEEVLFFDESFPDPNPPMIITREPPICRPPRMVCGRCGDRGNIEAERCPCGGALVVA